jgi:hypothetical protein
MKETEGESERKFKSKKTIFFYFLINLSSYNLDAIKCVCFFSIIIKIITFTVQISN